MTVLTAIGRLSDLATFAVQPEFELIGQVVSYAHFSWFR